MYLSDLVKHKGRENEVTQNKGRIEIRANMRISKEGINRYIIRVLLVISVNSSFDFYYFHWSRNDPFNK